MRIDVPLLVLLLCTSSAHASSLDRRLESHPGASWMDLTQAQLSLGAGRPSLAGESSELGLRGSFELRRGLALLLGAELLQAASFREERMRAGLALVESGWALRAQWEGSRAGIPGIVAEQRTRLVASIAMHSGPFAFGLRQVAGLGPTSHQLRDAMSWAIHLRLSGVVLALLREDALWGGDARWSAGLQFGVHPSLRLGLRGDDAQGQLVLDSRFGILGIRLSLPVASRIDAGPYLALEWHSTPVGVER